MNPPIPTIVITDWTFPDLSVEEGILKAHGVELVARQCQTEPELIALCAEADAVITQFARMNANVVSAMRKARAIVRYGIGVDNVDLDRARERSIPVCNVPELLKHADVLTLHCPSTPQTRRLMNRDTFAKLKPGAVFINVGRGDLVDPDALTAALQSGHLGAAALDVFDPEPIPAGHTLLTMANVILAPHIASCSVPAVKKLRESVATIALAAVRGEALLTVVNGVRQS